MKWTVEIKKTVLDHRNLIELLDGLDFKVVDGIEFPAFTSQEIEICKTAEEVYEIAKHLRDAITGPAQIDPEFTLGSVIDFSIDPPKRHTFLEMKSVVLESKVGQPTITTSPPKGISPHEIEMWEKERAEQDYQNKLEGQRVKLEPAYWSSRATKVLELLSVENPSGETIYKIYELAEGHPNKRNAFHAQFGITNKEFGRFQDTVHNPKVSGDWARHSYENTPRTKNPISREEAERFVREIAAKWLDHIRKTKNP